MKATTTETGNDREHEVKRDNAEIAAYGPDYAGHRLEQYKLAVEMADRISTRRLGTNKFFLGIASAIVAFTALFAASADSNVGGPAIQPLGVLAIALVGMVMSALWFQMLNSFSTLNSAKYQVIVGLEKDLPASIFAQEWELLSYGVTSGYRTLTSIEMRVPVVFGFLYLVMAGIAVGRLGGWR
jgi:hypothetical protein